MKKFITVVIVAFSICVFLGVTAFAGEFEVAEEIAPEMYSGETIPELETSVAEQVVVEEPTAEPEPEVVVTVETEAEPITEAEGVIADEREEVEDADAEEEAVTEPETEETVEDPKAEGIVAEQPVCEVPQVGYSITFSTGTASYDTVGGTQVAVKDILTGLGYSVEGAVITFNPDTVDTSVIQITETENGLVLTDFGPFVEANQKLVVYIDGETVELSVVDPVEIGDKDNPTSYKKYTAQDIINAFAASSSQDGHVKLVGNVILEDSGIIRLENGTHDLFLNGYTLDLDGGYFLVGNVGTANLGDDAILNIYGGPDIWADGDGIISSGGLYTLETRGSATVNIFGGSVLNKAALSSSTSCTLYTEDNSVVNLFNGTLSSTASLYVMNLGSDSKVNVIGGTVYGKLQIRSTFTDNRTDNPLCVAGGSFSGGYGSINPYYYMLNGPDNWNITWSEGVDTVTPKTYYSVSINKSGVMTAYTNLQGAVTAGDTVVLLQDVNESVSVANKTTVTLYLKGCTINGENLDKCIINNNGTLTLTDLPGKNGTVKNGNDSNGGGVYNAGTFTMYAGTITDCKATGDNGGGGVYNESGSTFSMYGGTITGCYGTDGAGGVCNLKKGIITIGGKAKITGNKADNKTANLCLCTTSTGQDYTTITIDNLLDGASIGVNITNGTVLTNNGTSDDLKYFFCDDSDNKYLEYVSDHIEVKNREDVSKTSTYMLESPEYCGKAVSPETTITLSDGATVLTEGTDYSVSCTNNVKPGDKTAAATITFLGKYKGIISTLFSILPATLTVSGTKVSDKAYDGTTSANVTAGTLNGKVEGEDVSIDSATGVFESRNASSQTVKVTYTLKGNDVSNYKINTEDITAKITQRELTITSGSDSKVYDGTELKNESITVTGDGFVGDENITCTYTGSQTIVGNSKNIFSYTAAGMTVLSNYSITKVEGILTINPRQITVNGTTVGDKTYDGTTTASATIGNISGIVTGDDVTVSIESATFDTENVGTGKDVTVVYKITGADAGNYTKPANETIGADITKSTALKFVVMGTTEEYGDRSYRFVYDGRLHLSDAAEPTISTNVGTIIYMSKDNIEWEATTFPNIVYASDEVINTKGWIKAENPNYETAYGSVIFVVAPLQLTIEGTTVEDKTYDGNTDAKVIVGVLKGCVSGDDVSPTATGAFEDEKIGEGKNVFVAYALTGADAKNYLVPASETLKASIKAQPIPSGGDTTNIKVVVVVEPVTVDSLPKAQQEAVNETLKAKNLTLLAAFQVYVLNGDIRTNKGDADFQIDVSAIKGYDSKTLRAWKINDDNTMIEVLYEVVNGKIIFNHGELGTYILTA